MSRSGESSGGRGPRRDLVGYGAVGPGVVWPGGARVALSIVVNYEEGSERSLWAGDDSNENLGEWTRSVGEGYRDLGTESVYEYGSRAGIFRLLRLLNSVHMKGTIFAAAMALEKNPEAAEAIRAAGHEVCAHGYRWSEEWTLSREEERERIGLAVESLKRTVGVRPVGWYSRWMASEYTRDLLVEEGGFLYDSNAYNDDLPYYVPVLGTQHLVLPYTLTYNDARYSVGHFGAPSDFLDYLIRGLDYLWEEGASDPKMMSVGLHARWSGQAARASVVREFLEYAAKKGDVWFATRREIAEWWMERQPRP